MGMDLAVMLGGLDVETSLEQLSEIDLVLHASTKEGIGKFLVRYFSRIDKNDKNPSHAAHSSKAPIWLKMCTRN